MNKPMCYQSGKMSSNVNLTQTVFALVSKTQVDTVIELTVVSLGIYSANVCCSSPVLKSYQLFVHPLCFC